MVDYEGQVKVTLHGIAHWVWVSVKAQSVAFARALLQAQYGRQNVNNVQRKIRR